VTVISKPHLLAMQLLWKKCDVVTVISGRSPAPGFLIVPFYDPALVGSSASVTATEVQLTIVNRNCLHQLAPICTNLRNLHQKIFCRKRPQ
jgi:hypothetical protein